MTTPSTLLGAMVLIPLRASLILIVSQRGKSRQLVRARGPVLRLGVCLLGFPLLLALLHPFPLVRLFVTAPKAHTHSGDSEE